MKKINIYYWIITGLFAAFMLSSAIPNIMVSPEWVTIITGLGYPKYFIPFIGVAKLLGIIVILIPGNSRIKEWFMQVCSLILRELLIPLLPWKVFSHPLALCCCPLLFYLLPIICGIRKRKWQNNRQVMFVNSTWENYLHFKKCHQKYYFFTVDKYKN